MDTDSTVVAETETTSTQASHGESDSGVVIETRNLSKIYRDFWGRKKVNALKSLDIEVRKAKFLVCWDPTAVVNQPRSS